MTEEQKDLTRRAKEKWQNKTILGPEGEFFVSVVYWRGEGWLEALVFPEERKPIILKLLDMKKNYTIKG